MTQLISLSVTAILILNIFLGNRTYFSRKKGPYSNMGLAPRIVFHPIIRFLYLPPTR